MIPTKMNAEVLKYIYDLGTQAHLTEPNRIFCFMPFWIEVVDMKEGLCHWHSLDKAPQELKDFLREKRQEKPYGYLYDQEFFKRKEDIVVYDFMYKEEDIIPLYK